MRAPSETLADLLRSLFTTDQLRIHLAGGPDGIALVDSLPGAIASPALFAHAAAVELARRGLVTDEFFARLATACAHRRDDIDRTRDAWLAASRPAAGLVLAGRYRLARQLGEGGVASVWCAIDEQTGQIVAVKLMHPRHEDDARVRRRFFRGAVTLTNLHHPSIVRVLAAVEEDGRRCFYVMENVPGVTLDVCVRERRYKPATLLALALKVGDALVHVHSHGLLHRDVKPANILVLDAESVRLIDFDLVTGEDFVAQTTQAVGTGHYMPPEAHTADRKTAAYDVYSLARTIEFILRGRDSNAGELFDITSLPATAEVRAILRAALEPDPQRRIRDMATFCAALRAALAPAQPSAPPPDPAPDVDPPRPAVAPWRVPAIASIAGHLVAINAAAPPGDVLLLLVFLTAPSIRVLVDREDNRFVTYLHWLWIAVWLLPAPAILSALFASRTARKLEPFPALALLAAIALGIYASVTWLRRPRPPR